MRQAEIDPTKFPISGYARAAMERGNPSAFECPLISHIEGNLWMGGCIEGVRLPDDFKTVFALYDGQSFRVGPSTEVVRMTMLDSLTQSLDSVDSDARRIVDAMKHGKVLVHCQAGLNRSGLLTARVLTLMGHSGPEAISILRERRSPLVLCNEAFENWIAGIA